MLSSISVSLIGGDKVAYSMRPNFHVRALTRQWLIGGARKLAIDVLFLLLVAVVLYWLAVTFGWLSSKRDADAETYRAVQAYAAPDVQLQWRMVDLHGFGSESLVVLVRPSLPLGERLDEEQKVRPYIVVLDKRSASFLDRLAQRQPGFYEAYKLTLDEPADLLFGWDANMRIVELQEGRPPVTLVEWSSPTADDTLRVVTLTTWDGRYSTSFLPNPLALLQIEDPFPHLGHPEFVASGGEHLEGWYLNRFSAYSFLNVDDDTSMELASLQALEFVKGYTYEGECRACPHHFVVALWDVDPTPNLHFSPNLEWGGYLDGQRSESYGQRTGAEVTDLVNPINLREFLRSEINRRSPPSWSSPDSP